jgi:hypothetical protein
MRGERKLDIIRFDRRVRRFQNDGEDQGRPETRAGLEVELLGMLAAGGPILPAAVREDGLKQAFMERAAVLRQAGTGAQREKTTTVVIPRARARLSFARVAVVTAVVMALLLGTGAASSFAMPGNPLYTLKRVAEAAYLSIVPGDQSKAEAYASWTDRRLNDLEYVEDRDMSKWYYGLVRDVEGGIEKADRRAERLQTNAAEKVRARGRRATLRLEALFQKALGGMTPNEKANVEDGLNRVRRQLRMRQGSPSDSQQPGQYGAPSGQSSGPGYTKPTEPNGSIGTQTQQGTQQQGPVDQGTQQGPVDQGTQQGPVDQGTQQGQSTDQGTQQQGPADQGTQQQVQTSQPGGPGQAPGNQVQQP